MARHSFEESSSLNWAGYNPATQKLTVCFKRRNATYDYFGVPPEDYEDLCEVGGSYLSKYIAGVYPHERQKTA